jgi:hypothetical protein
MNRCLDCNSLLTPTETTCAECGGVAPVQKLRPADILARVVNIVFYASAVMTLASIFLPAGPGFTKSVLILVAMLFLKRSVKESTSKSYQR